MLNKECGWKEGDRAGSAEKEKTQGKKRLEMP
jgi:hypothetical protein